MSTCPSMPSIPQEVLMRFRTMRDYDAKMRLYAAALCGIIPDPTDITDLENRVSALEATGFVDDLGWVAHIAATVAHGTISDIVGESDVQNLDSKTIGNSVPGYGRFTHALQRNTIPVTDTLTIPADYNMVNCGAYTIDGTLTVAGSAAFL